MSVYTNFIGIDIGKFDIVAGVHGQKTINTYTNTTEGFEKFCCDYKEYLPSALVILETTGGYERLFAYGLGEKKIAVHRANTRQVKAFIRSLGIKGKTDKIDALALARYGYERHKTLMLYCPASDVQQDLKGLVERRLDLNKLLVQEKNRHQAPGITAAVKQSCKQMIESIDAQLTQITEQIKDLMALCPQLMQKASTLLEIAGIGQITATQLLILLPELGQCNRRQIASLVGLAPHPHDSGTKQGYRSTFGGRHQVRTILFMCAMAAARSKSRLGDFYRRLIAQGKTKMVALTALMRKIIVIANAKLKEQFGGNSETFCGKSV